MRSPIRVATRGSALALTQTEQLIELLGRHNPRVRFELLTCTTTGDKVTDRPLSSFRGTGIFVNELRAALVEHHADLAVHSLKDIPIDQPTELTLAAFPCRADPRDLLLSRNNEPFDHLPQNATVGTSSPRRMVQLKAARPDLHFADLRGNLDTRIRKLEEGRYDAIVVAAAGMQRLGRDYPESALLPPELCLPAAGQGALAVECRGDDPAALAVAASANHETTAMAVTAERAFLAGIGGGCSMPIAARAIVGDTTLQLEGLVGERGTGRIVRDGIHTPWSDIAEAGKKLADRLRARCEREGIAVP
jgi:hydroxymethylbilane synthase